MYKNMGIKIELTNRFINEEVIIDKRIKIFNILNFLRFCSILLKLEFLIIFRVNNLRISQIILEYP